MGGCHKRSAAVAIQERSGSQSDSGSGSLSPISVVREVKGSASSVNKISLGKYENSVCHVASTVAVKIDYR
eukprot:COSAG01_NODE_419_length_17278_cov_34.763432_4_plen_71_part_00